jgi:uncharacterized protein (DUF488 family)
VLTIGHSTRPLPQFIELLKSHGVLHLVDVRTIPRSARHPQFNLDTLPEQLASVGIAYTHMRGLGGLRRPRADSINLGWRNAGFRGFADYMQTEAFEVHLAALVDLAARGRTAIMCAEAVPWRCHRSLVADALVVRGAAVEHILSAARGVPHRLSPHARVSGQRVTYPRSERRRDRQSAVKDP